MNEQGGEKELRLSHAEAPRDRDTEILGTKGQKEGTNAEKDNSRGDAKGRRSGERPKRWMRIGPIGVSFLSAAPRLRASFSPPCLCVTHKSEFDFPKRFAPPLQCQYFPSLPEKMDKIFHWRWKTLDIFSFSPPYSGAWKRNPDRFWRRSGVFSCSGRAEPARPLGLRSGFPAPGP